MRALAHILIAAFLTTIGILFAPGTALACGGFYASEIEVASDQHVVIAHRGGTETYVFRPHFCGAAKDFGVILPIPAALSSAPALADNALFDDLDRYSEPEVIEVCESRGIGCGAAAGDGAIGGTRNQDFGVNVVDRGRVGIFEYVLLQATTATAFTDWLTQNGFPYDANQTPVYESYVQRQWYFVAFKVTADTSAPPAGQKLCGDLGPIQLAFPSANPVVPARITAVNTSGGPVPIWRLFLISPAQQKLGSGAFSSNLYFSKALPALELSSFAALDAMANDGERLTVLDVTFPSSGASDDINLVDDPDTRDFRSQREVPKDCGLTGCAAGSSMATSAVGAAMVFGFLGLMRRSKRRVSQRQ